MAVFTAVTESQLAGWMRHYDLGEVVEFRGITSGIENSNFFLTTTRGEYVLTIFEKLTAGQLPFYLNLMRHLAEHRVPVPDPMPREDGSLFGILHGKPAAIVTKLEGAPELAPGVEHCIEVGQMLARMHLAGRDYTGYQPNLRSLPWWKETVPTILPFLEGEQRDLLSSELAYQEAFFASADYAALPEGPCHADLFRDNAMFAHAAPETGRRLRQVAVRRRRHSQRLVRRPRHGQARRGSHRSHAARVSDGASFYRRRKPSLGRHAARGRVPFLGLAPV
jgi:homoserine kinase type II